MKTSERRRGKQAAVARLRSGVWRLRPAVDRLQNSVSGLRNSVPWLRLAVETLLPAVPRHRNAVRGQGSPSTDIATPSCSPPDGEVGWTTTHRRPRGRRTGFFSGLLSVGPAARQPRSTAGGEGIVRVYCGRGGSLSVQVGAVWCIIPPWRPSRNPSVRV